MEEAKSLYQYPEIYTTLLSPEPEVWNAIQYWISLYLKGECESVLDPACGPATWLLPFAEQGAFVGGNDLEVKMVEAAKERLLAYPHELLEGDMRRLNFSRDSFDIAVNLDGSIGHLKDYEQIKEHLSEVTRLLRVGGLYFVGLMVLDGRKVNTQIEELYESPFVDLPSGGQAKVHYRSEHRDPIRSCERVCLELEVKNSALYPRFMKESYELLTFPAQKLVEIISKVEGLSLLATHSIDVFGYPDILLEENCGDVILVLQRDV